MKVKQLVWEEKKTELYGIRIHVSNISFGLGFPVWQYYIRENFNCDNKSWSINCWMYLIIKDYEGHNGDNSYYEDEVSKAIWEETLRMVDDTFLTIYAAKAACQAHYESLILSGLEI